MNENFLTYTAEDFKTNYGLYQQMIRIMTVVDGAAPIGSCCGKNKDSHIEKFINNREKYLSRMEAIKDRKIKPLFSGCRMIGFSSQMICADLMTDEDILSFVKQHPNGKSYFDFTAYNEANNTEVEETVVEEKKVSKRGRKSSKNSK